MQSCREPVHRSLNDREPAHVWPAGTSNGFRETGQAAAIALAIATAIGAVGGWPIYRDWSAQRATRLAAEQRAGALDRLLDTPAGEAIPFEVAVRGHELFSGACAACHKADGTGMPGLGKDLVHSAFVASLGDDELRHFLAEGRPANSPDNTTRMPMPPKGGRDDLTDADLSAIVAYLRGLQDARRMPDLSAAAVAVTEPVDEDPASIVTASDVDPELAEYIASGSKIYAQSCASCHGRDAKGVKGLGKDLVDSKFCRTLDDDGLLEFVKKGRDPGDPANTTGIGMPAKGGNPALSDDDILDVIAYVRSLQEQADAKN